MKKMKVLFVFRKKSFEKSINRVFEFIMPYLDCEKDIYYAPRHGGKLSIIVSNIFDIIKYRKNNKSDLTVITGDINYMALGLKSNSTIIVQHDMGIVANEKLLKKIYHLIFWFYLPYLKCKKIVAISEFTKNEIIKYCSYFKEKIVVIPDPVDPEFCKTPYEFNKEEPIILQVGTRNNKNLENVIKAVSGIRCHLRIIGNLSDKQRSLLADSSVNYSNVFNISNQEIINEYCSCDLVVFASLYEGFGMPIIEAQAVGRPVITSDISPMKEVAGEGAVLINPYDVGELTKAIILLINDRELRQNLVEKGFSNCKKYYAQEVANRYLELYRKISYDS